uniref:DUF4130 domain-containing protein n=1 Tax=Chlorobium chlorochromatii (strain CaD3) TaxID=340177 RepID=Q3AQ96_CHLCH
MNRYLYDGTADGLLSAISWILEEEQEPEQVVLAEREDTLFEEGIFLNTDVARSEALFSRFRKQLPDVAQTLYFFMLAESNGMATNLLHYMALALQYGDRVNGYLTHPAVKAIVHLSRKASRELHRMKGLLRFEQLCDGAYLAQMSPDHNILHPLSHHFRHRLKAEHWFIVDRKRHTAAHWHQGSLEFGTIEQFNVPALSEQEQKVQTMWRTFFATIAIQERKNPALQRSNMPMKYWKYLTEKQ